MISTHPKVGMAVLIGARVKAKVRAGAGAPRRAFVSCRADGFGHRSAVLLRLPFRTRGGPRGMSSPLQSHLLAAA